MTKKTKIVATIGPASESPIMLSNLFRLGVDVCRLNFSHGEYLWHKKAIGKIRRAAGAVRKKVGIMADIQGPRIRVMNRAPLELVLGEKIFLTDEVSIHHHKKKELMLDWEGFYQHLKKGALVYIEDGLISLKVVKREKLGCWAEVTSAGLVKPHKGVNIPSISHFMGFLTEKDFRDLDFVLEQGVDLIAVSFVATGKDISRLRTIITEKLQTKKAIQKKSGKKEKIILPWIVSKIERKEAVEHLEGIIEASDAIMVARGDLAIEMPQEKLGILQKEIISKCRKHKKPVIVATQMAHTMIENSRPTRAEISDITNAVIDGADAIMFSGETAQGKFPIKVVETAASIIYETEKSPLNDTLLGRIGKFARMILGARKGKKNRRRKILLANSLPEAIAISSLRQEDIVVRLKNPLEKEREKLSLVWGAE